MICEKLFLEIDLAKLRKFVDDYVLKLPPLMVSDHFGGWSVLSSDGTYTDGFTKTTFIYDSSIKNIDQVKSFMANAKVKAFREYWRPTELYHGYAKELVEQLTELGLDPKRVRFMLLKAGGKCSMHRDNPDWLYGVRLHIPIFTNEKCLFDTEEEGSTHLEAGSAYLLRVNRMHRVLNGGNTDRIHLVASVHDNLGISQFHKYTQEHKDEENRRKK